MDFTQKGNLYQKLKKDKFFDETAAFHYFIQTCSAVNFLHSNNLVHRDLKPENLLLDESNNIKLCDFGWCVELNLGNRVTFCGTYEYMAPEIINELPYNNSIDIWSLGILLYELIHGYSPFKVLDDN
jgi:serine/threonine protein kinase